MVAAAEDDHPGESHDDKHKNEIDVLSWTWSETQSGTFAGGGGGGAGKVSMHDFNFTMKMNKASPKLMLACANGEHFPKATLTCRKAGKEQQEYFKVVMTDLLVSSYQTGGSAHADVVPVDSISLNFTKIEFSYKIQKPDGTLGDEFKAGYDLQKNTKV